MKTILLLFLVAVPIAVSRAQDSDCATGQSADCGVAAVVYDAPVVYNGPVVYQTPVVYNGPVYYVTPGTSVGCAGYAPSCAQNDYSPSTVLYIGGGHVAYQESSCNSGSTVTYIGHSRFH